MQFLNEKFLRGAIGYMISLTLGKFFKFIFIMVSVRLLAPHDFGILTLSISLIYLISDMAGMGLPTAILKFISKDNEPNDSSAFSSIIVMGLVSGLFSAILFISFSTFFCVRFLGKPEMILPLQILAFSIIPTVLLNVTRATFQKKEKIKWIVATESIQNLLTIVIFVSSWLLFHSIYISLISYTVATVISLIISLRYYLKKTGIIISFLNRAAIGPVLRFSLPIMLISACVVSASRMGHFMLGSFLTLEEVGKYGIVYSLSTVLILIHKGFASIFKPLASEANKNNGSEELRRSYLFMSKWVSLCNGLLLLVYAGFGNYILSFMGLSFTDNKLVLVLLILSTYNFFGTWVGASGSFLQMLDKQNLDLINMIIFFISMTLFSYWLTSAYGTIGAAIAVFAAGFIRNMLQILEMKIIFNFNPIGREQLKIFFGIIFFVVLSFYCKDKFAFAESIVALVGMGVTCMYVLNKTGEEEKKMIRSVFKKKLKILQ